jgi:oligosaccharide repeat unit polymerase
MLVGSALGAIAILLSGFVLICCIPWCIAYYKRDIDLFEPINLASIFMFIHAYSIFYRVYLTERKLRYEELIEITFSEAFILITILHIVFFAAVLVGYYIHLESLYHHLPKLPDETESVALLFKYLGYIYIFIGSFSYIFLIYMALGGDLFYVFTSSVPRNEIFSSSPSQFLMLLSELLYYGYFIWLLSTISQGNSPKLFQLILVVPIFGLFTLLGGRGLALRIILIYVIILYYTWIRGLFDINRNHFMFREDSIHYKFKLSIIPLLGPVMLVIADVLLALRRGELNIYTSTKILRIFAFREELFDNLLVLVSITPSKIGYYYGSYYIRPILNFIPRSLWENKPPLTIGAELRQIVWPNQSGGRPPGVLGELFVNFGYPTIILGGIVGGIAMRMAYELLKKNSHSTAILLIYIVATLSIATNGTFSNGSLFNLYYTLPILAPLVLIIFYVESS